MRGEHARARAREPRRRELRRASRALPPLRESAACTTGSQSLRPPACRKPRIVIAGESLVNSGALKISAVLTVASGRTSRKTGSGKSSGVSCSPTPSAQAGRPWTKTGTSAPSARPSAASSSSGQPQAPEFVERDQHRGRIGAAAPDPALHRQPLAHLDGDARRVPRVAGASSRAARTQRSSSAGTSRHAESALDRPPSAAPRIEAHRASL